MNQLYMTHDEDGYELGEYASFNGYTMAREQHLKGMPWVLRDPSGEWVDSDGFRSKLAHRNGFGLDGDDWIRWS